MEYFIILHHGICQSTSFPVIQDHFYEKSVSAIVNVKFKIRNSHIVRYKFTLMGNKVPIIKYKTTL